MVAQIEELHTVMRREVSDATINGDVIDGLLLCHVFVVQVADIANTVRIHQVDASCFIGDDQGLGYFVVADTGNVRTMKT